MLELALTSSYCFNMNTQQESSCIYGANRELVIDQTIDGIEQAEDVLIFAPFLMNVDPP